MCHSYYSFFTSPAEPLSTKPVTAWKHVDVMTWLGTLDAETRGVLEPEFTRKQISECEGGRGAGGGSTIGQGGGDSKSRYLWRKGRKRFFFVGGGGCGGGISCPLDLPWSGRMRGSGKGQNITYRT